MRDRTFVRDCCNILKIPRPKIIFCDTVNNNPTQMGASDVKNNILYIKKNLIEYDTYFAIAHELRHLYQFNNGADLSNHREVGEVTSDEYNLQEEELDANAFGFLVMFNRFGVEPLFRGLSPKIKRLVEERAKELANLKGVE